jgi:hypothetical protein
MALCFIKKKESLSNKKLVHSGKSNLNLMPENPKMQSYEKSDQVTYGKNKTM